MKRFGLALGGGGARGLCHMEFLQVLDEMGVKPTLISGTSIGSIIGAFYAAGMSASQIKDLYQSIGLKEMTHMIDFSLFPMSGMVKGEGVTDFLNEHLPVKWFEDLPIQLKIVATDFWKREEVVFEKGEIIPAVRASISIPGVFQPIKINSRILVDGGIVNPLPMSIIRDECDILIAIDVSGSSEPPARSPSPTMFNTIMTSFQIMENKINYLERQRLNPEIYLKPALKNFQILDFHHEKEIIESVSGDIAAFRKELAELLKRSDKKKRKKEIALNFWKR